VLPVHYRAFLTAVGFGFAMHLAAHLAGSPGWGWVQWVVNWGAPWVIIPFLAGRRSDRASTAVLVGALLGATEVALYYGVENLDGHKVAWLVLGGAVSGVFGLLGLSSRAHRFGPLLVPVLMILEPIGISAVFLLLGRPPGSHWFGSCLAELTIGLFLAAGVAKLRPDLGHARVT
jgi:hypothetical protein